MVRINWTFQAKGNLRDVAKKLIFSAVFLLNCLAIYSQNKLEPGVYLSEDKLQYITILNDTDFGYKTFNGTSPYLHKKEKKNNSFCGSVLFEIDKRGFGKYKLSENKELQLAFKNNEKPLDSINIKKIARGPNIDSTSVIFVIKTYSYKEIENQLYGVNIKLNDGSIEFDTGFETTKSIKIAKHQFPLTFIINGYKEVTFEEFNGDYLTLLYFNFTKMGKSVKYDDMTYSLDKLIKIE